MTRPLIRRSRRRLDFTWRFAPRTRDGRSSCGRLRSVAAASSPQFGNEPGVERSTADAVSPVATGSRIRLTVVPGALRRGRRSHRIISQPRSERPRNSRGLTLLEMLLVLGLLVLVAALAAPSVGLTLESNRLRSSGDLVRASLAKARIKAMESGRTYNFRYQPGGNGYVIEAWYSPDDYLESSALAAGSMGGGMMSGNVPIQNPLQSPAQNPMQSSPPADPQTLPESITFAGSETTTDRRAAMLMQTSATGQSIDEQWSQPIFFYADGTSSTARLVIMNARQRYITLTLRGLTGVVKVSRPTVASEIPQ